MKREETKRFEEPNLKEWIKKGRKIKKTVAKKSLVRKGSEGKGNTKKN